jgi:hypothetical protein
VTVSASSLKVGSVWGKVTEFSSRIALETAPTSPVDPGVNHELDQQPTEQAQQEHLDERSHFHQSRSSSVR